MRDAAGLFDVSHMGEVVFRGPKALEALQRALHQRPRQARQTARRSTACLCRETGGIVDDVVVYRRAADDLLVCVNACEPRRRTSTGSQDTPAAPTSRNESDALGAAGAAGAAGAGRSSSS